MFLEHFQHIINQVKHQGTAATLQKAHTMLVAIDALSPVQDMIEDWYLSRPADPLPPPQRPQRLPPIPMLPVASSRVLPCNLPTSPFSSTSPTSSSSSSSTRKLGLGIPPRNQLKSLTSTASTLLGGVGEGRGGTKKTMLLLLSKIAPALTDETRQVRSNDSWILNCCTSSAWIRQFRHFVT